MIATLVVVRWSAPVILLLLNLILDPSDGTHHLQVAGRCSSSHRNRWHGGIQRHHDVSGEDDVDGEIDEQQRPYSYTWRWKPATPILSVDAFEISQLSVAVSSQTSFDRRRKPTPTYLRFGGRNDDAVGHHCRRRSLPSSLELSSSSSQDKMDMASTTNATTSNLSQSSSNSSDVLLQNIHEQPQQQQQHHQQSPSTMARTTSKNYNICMILPQTHDGSDSSSSSMECYWTDEAMGIAQRLEIPCLTFDQLVQTFVTDSGDHDKDSSEGDESSLSPSSVPEPTRYSHILRLVPYNYQGDLDKDHDSLSMGTSTKTTYALAIESIGNQDPHNESKKRRKKKNQKLSNRKLKLSSNPFYIDLDPYSNTKTRRRTSNSGGGQKDLLVQAVKPPSSSASASAAGSSSSSSSTFIIHDWTAGLGQDSMVLASSIESSGLHTAPTIIVWMFERDPIVGALLQDALRRLDLLSEGVSEIDTCTESLDRISLSKRLHLVLGDGKYLARAPNSLALDEGLGTEDEDSEMQSSLPSSLSPSPFQPKPDVVYLDPMFPPRQKSAAVKKGMALLQELLETQHVNKGDDDENDDYETERINEEIELLLAALECAQVRVVVKRPIKAPPLGFPPSQQQKSNKENDVQNLVAGRDENKRIIPKPSYDLKGSINRFDIYVI